MINRRTLATVALAAALPLLAACGDSYEDKTTACITAVKERTDPDGTRPAACDGISDEDYATIVFGNAIDDLGWTDDEGRFDKNKMIEETTP